MQHTLFSEIEYVDHIPSGEKSISYDKSWIRPKDIRDTRVFCVVFDRDNLQGQKLKMSEFFDNIRLVHARHKKQFPLEMVKMIYTLQKIITSPEYSVTSSSSTLGGGTPAFTVEASGSVTSGGIGGVDKNGKKKKIYGDDEAVEGEPEDEEAAVPAKMSRQASTSTGEKGGKASEKSPEQLEKEKMDKINAQKTTFTNGVGGFFERVEQYIETIRDLENRVIGWRFWYVVNDARSFNFHTALSNLFHSNKVAAEKEAARVQRNGGGSAGAGAGGRPGGGVGAKRYATQVDNRTLNALDVNSAEEWICEVMNRYHLNKVTIKAKRLDEKKEKLIEYEKTVHEDFANNPKAMHLNLSNPDHPAYFSKFCSFDASCAILKDILPNAKPQYSDPSQYILNEVRLRFPFFAKFVFSKDRHPKVFHNVMLEEDDFSRLSLAGLDEWNQKTLITENHKVQMKQQRLFAEDMADVTEHALKLNQEHFQEADFEVETKGIPRTEAYRKVRESMAFQERLQTVFASFNSMGPGTRACVEWIEKQKVRGEIEKKPWSAIRPVGTLDPKMSHFAKMRTRNLFIWETVFGLVLFHQEMEMIYLWRFGVFDSREDKLYTHMMLSGKAAIGKSWLLRLLSMICVPGTVQKVAHDTAKAYCSGGNFNELIFSYDEMSRNILDPGDGGQGDPLMKTALSDGKIITRTVEIDKYTGERCTVEYTCWLNMQVIGNLNLPKERVPEPILSRFLFTDIAKHIRQGVDFVLKSQELGSKKEDEKLVQKHCEEMQLIQCLVACIEFMIGRGFLPQVDMEAALLYWSKIKEECQLSSVFVEPRKDRHIQNQMRNCALEEAATRVFCTEDFFLEGTPFEYDQLMKVAPFLFVTEEHVLFSISELEHAISDPNLLDIVEALNTLCLSKGAAEGTHAFSTMKVKGLDAVDYDYYLLEMSGSIVIEASAVIQKVAGMVVDQVKRSKQKQLFEPSVYESIKWMTNQTLECPKYVGNTDEVSQDTHTLSIGKVRLNLKDNKYGFDISRKFVSQVLSFGETSTNTAGVSSSPDDDYDDEENIANYQGGNGKKKKTAEARANTKRIDDYDMATRSIVQGVLAKTFKSTPERRVILGQTFRHHESMFPFLFRCMDRVPSATELLEITNLKYRMYGFEYAIHNRPETQDDERELPFIKLDSNISLDEHQYRMFLSKYGIDESERCVDFPVSTSWTEANREKERKEKLHSSFSTSSTLGRNGSITENIASAMSETPSEVATTMTTTTTTTTTTTSSHHAFDRPFVDYPKTYLSRYRSEFSSKWAHAQKYKSITSHHVTDNATGMALCDDIRAPRPIDMNRASVYVAAAAPPPPHQTTFGYSTSQSVFNIGGVAVTVPAFSVVPSSSSSSSAMENVENQHPPGSESGVGSLDDFDSRFA
jgi:hypothetical protein